MRINVEGHCDERGTAEYNLGLGERRANAVKAYLVELGVPGDRVVVVSKGKESPFCTESNESCWQQNRRGHFIDHGEVTGTQFRMLVFQRSGDLSPLRGIGRRRDGAADHQV